MPCGHNGLTPKDGPMPQAECLKLVTPIYQAGGNRSFVRSEIASVTGGRLEIPERDWHRDNLISFWGTTHMMIANLILAVAASQAMLLKKNAHNSPMLVASGYLFLNAVVWCMTLAGGREMLRTRWVYDDLGKSQGQDVHYNIMTTFGLWIPVAMATMDYNIRTASRKKAELDQAEAEAAAGRLDAGYELGMMRISHRFKFTLMPVFDAIFDSYEDENDRFAGENRLNCLGRVLLNKRVGLLAALTSAGLAIWEMYFGPGRMAMKDHSKHDRMILMTVVILPLMAFVSSLSGGIYAGRGYHTSAVGNGIAHNLRACQLWILSANLWLCAFPRWTL